MKITDAAPAIVPDTVPDSCDTSVTEPRKEHELAIPVLSHEDETFLDVEALDEILFDALSTL